jgi:hypothetical protein
MGVLQEVTPMVASTTIDQNDGRVFNQSNDGTLLRRRTVEESALSSNVGHFGLGTVGLLLVAISAWGAIVPFLGPTFGYSADGAGSWHWSLTHAVVSVAPGAVGVVIGMVILAGSRGLVVGRGRLSLAGAGLIVLAAGAWFAVAPWAWPVVDNTRAYFVGASPLRFLANIAGYALGPGLIVAACGAFFLGWATRHQNTGAAVLRDEIFAPAPAPVTPASATQGQPATSVPAAQVQPVAPAPATQVQPVTSVPAAPVQPVTPVQAAPVQQVEPATPVPAAPVPAAPVQQVQPVQPVTPVDD